MKQRLVDSESIVLLGLCATLHGCMSRDAGFHDVSQFVRARVGADVVWHTEGNDQGVMTDDAHRLLAESITAESAVRIALANNRDLQDSFEELGVAQGALLGASLLPNPRISGDIRPVLGSSTPGSPFFDVTASIDITRILFLPLRRGAAQATFEATQFWVAGHVIDTAYNAEVAFYRFQSAAQMLELAKTISTATHASLEAARLLNVAGTLTRFELLEHQAFFEESLLGVVSAENDLYQARERLNVELGLWGADAKMGSPGRFVDPPAQEVDMTEIERQAVERSVELAAIARRIDAAGSRLGLAHAEGIIPSLRVGATVVREDGPLSVGPSAELTVPVFDQNQGEVRVRESDLRRARFEYVSVAVRVRSIARAERMKLEFARARAVWFHETLLPLRAATVDEAMKQYNAMQIDLFQLLQVRRNQIETGRGYIRSLRDYWIARASLSRVLAGRSLEGDHGTMDGTARMTPDDESGTP